METAGVTVVRDLPVFGHHDQHGHAVVTFEDVRVPVANVVGEEGGGFAAAQARLGPGRIHHCMRALGAAERALALLVARAQQRVAFGSPLADQGVVRQQIAESRLEIDQARLLCHRAATSSTTQGNKAAASLVAMAKVAVPPRRHRRHRPGHPGARRGRRHRRHATGRDVRLAPRMRLFDGPDEVHLRSIAKADGPRAVLPPGSTRV